jgi:hypothetical protein
MTAREDRNARLENHVCRLPHLFDETLVTDENEDVEKHDQD